MSILYQNSNCYVLEQKLLILKSQCNSKMQNYESSEESVQEKKFSHK